MVQDQRSVRSIHYSGLCDEVHQLDEAHWLEGFNGLLDKRQGITQRTIETFLSYCDSYMLDR